MADNLSRRWAERRERLLVARALEAGLEFNSANIREIVKEMSYDVQREKHPEDCPCYSSQPCHGNLRDFNCFFCGCPNYNNSKKDNLGFVGGCRARVSCGKYFENSNPGQNGFGGKIWDCSGCERLHDALSAELALIVSIRHYASLAEVIKRECNERGFSDFKCFADYLSKEVFDMS